MKLLVKLLGAFILVSLIIAVVGLAGLFGADTLTRQILDIGTKQMPRSIALLTIREAIISVENAENALLIKGSTPEMKADAYAAFDDAKKRMDDALEMYTAYALRGDESQLWKQFLLAMTAWTTDHDQFVRLARNYDASPSDDIYGQMFDQAKKYSQVSIGPVLQLLAQDNDLQVKGAANAIAQAKSASARIRLVSFACLIMGPVLAFILGILLALSITRPLARGVAFAQRVASGDLTTRLSDGQRGEIGVLADALNTMSADLSQIVATIQSSADQVATSSKESPQRPFPSLKARRARQRPWRKQAPRWKSCQPPWSSCPAMPARRLSPRKREPTRCRRLRNPSLRLPAISARYRNLHRDP